MRLRLGAPRRVLVVAPHPDDETIGAYGLIARLRRCGAAVRVLVVSDGAASHPSSLRWPRSRLVAERRRESRRAVLRIGVPATEVIFLDLPDSRLHAHAGALRRGLTRALGQSGSTLVVRPAPDDDHPDHRAVAACVGTVRRPGLRVIDYPVWPAGRRPASARALVLSAQERLAKRYALRGYRTQAGRITDDPAGFAMSRAQIAAFSRPQEMFVERRR